MIDIRAERLNRGLSIVDLAALIGVPEHVIRHTEKGGRPQPANALRIASFFGLTVTEMWPLPDPDDERAAA